MTRIMTCLTVLALVAAGVQAQDPPPRPEPGPRAQVLREQVEARFGRMVQADLELTDTQMQQVRQAIRANQDRRIAMMRREQDLRRDARMQMERGGSANADSVSRLTESISRLRVEKAQSDDQLVRDLGFLPPVKRARLLNMMQRFEQRVQEIRQRSQMGPRRGIR